ncbi:MAG: hypothetical protein CMI63_09280 [Parvularcula sp.]|nr:hypothetical protein [Parvularcula sp.]
MPRVPGRQGGASFSVRKRSHRRADCCRSYRAYIVDIYLGRNPLVSRGSTERRFMKLPKRTTWFLIADSAKARIFESSGPGGTWALVEETADEDARKPSRDLGRDRLPRGRAIGAGAPFSVTESDDHEKAGQEFLLARVQDIVEAEKKERFDQLVVAAPPAALGVIRKKLPAETTAKLIGVYDKDLTNETERELHDYFLEKLERW